MIFLTVNDAPSGILRSQVIDVVNVLRKEAGADIKLVVFISIRNFRANRKWVKKNCPGAKVYPMVPRLKNWRKNRMIMSFIGHMKTDAIIARGVFATNIALDLKAKGKVKKVCYDGRGAFKAEVTEYDVIPDPEIVQQIPALEERAVLESDYRIAVTEKLVDYWDREFGYNLQQHVVIPCTVSADFTMPALEDMQALRNDVRNELLWGENDVVLVYSGSVAGWQSFGGLARQLEAWLQNKSEHRVLFLSKEDEVITKLATTYPTQVQRRWLNHDEVQAHLFAGDYGIMIREQSVTNKVASPTKFAEYLMAGLPVLCSPEIGDYAAFVETHDCGHLIKPEDRFEDVNLQPVEVTEKQRLMQLGFDHFSKSSDTIVDRYKTLHQALTSN